MSPGYDLVSGEVLKQRPRKGLLLLTAIFNSVLRIGNFPVQWNVSQIIVKKGKDLTSSNSYRPISLLSITSKVFDKLLLSRLKPLINENNLTLQYRLGFREKRGTIEQINRFVNIIH